MNRQPRGPGGASDAALERALVLLLLEDGTRRWAVSELAAELEIEAARLQARVGALHDDGVVCRSEAKVWASPAARRLDELQLIAI